MGLRSYLRGDRHLEGAYASDEQRSLPRPENELPLLGGYTASTVTPTQALAIGDVWPPSACSPTPPPVSLSTPTARPLTAASK